MNFRTLLVIAGLTATAPVLAHDVKGPNGGRVVDAGSYHAELVSTDRSLELFLSDANHKPVSATGYKAIAVIAVQGKSQRVVLEPAGESRLRGTPEVALGASPKGVVQVTGPDGKTFQAKF